MTKLILVIFVKDILCDKSQRLAELRRVWPMDVGLAISDILVSVLDGENDQEEGEQDYKIIYIIMLYHSFKA